MVLTAKTQRKTELEIFLIFSSVPCSQNSCRIDFLFTGSKYEVLSEYSSTLLLYYFMLIYFLTGSQDKQDFKFPSSLSCKSCLKFSPHFHCTGYRRNPSEETPFKAHPVPLSENSDLAIAFGQNSCRIERRMEDLSFSRSK